MEEVLISFGTAVLAREKGFHVENKEDFYFYCGSLGSIHKFEYLSVGYGDDIPAPTQSLLAKWLRDVHKIEVYVTPNQYGRYQGYYAKSYKIKYNNGVLGGYVSHETYEEALEVSLKGALELIQV